MFYFDYGQFNKTCSIILLSPIKTNPLSALFLLIGFSILIAGSFLAAFLWSVKNGQYEDDYTPSVRILFDDTVIPQKPKKVIKIITNNPITNTENQNL